MIRIICRMDDYGDAANVGGAVVTRWRTFEIPAPAVEAWLKDSNGKWRNGQIVAVEAPEPIARERGSE